MSGYWIVLGASRDDSDAAASYRELWQDIAQKYEARIEAGPTGHVCKEGGDIERLFVVRFPTFERAVACYESPEYREARRYATAAYDRTVFIVPGTPERSSET